MVGTAAATEKFCFLAPVRCQWPWHVKKIPSHTASHCLSAREPCNVVYLAGINTSDAKFLGLCFKKFAIVRLVKIFHFSSFPLCELLCNVNAPFPPHMKLCNIGTTEQEMCKWGNAQGNTPWWLSG